MSRIERKPGIYEAQISADRARRAKALSRQVADPSAAYHADKGFTKVPVGFIHAELAHAKIEQANWGRSRLAAIFQGHRQKFTDRGDFTHLSGRGV